MAIMTLAHAAGHPGGVRVDVSSPERNADQLEHLDRAARQPACASWQMAAGSSLMIRPPACRPGPGLGQCPAPGRSSRRFASRRTSSLHLALGETRHVRAAGASIGEPCPMAPWRMRDEAEDGRGHALFPAAPLSPNDAGGARPPRARREETPRPRQARHAFAVRSVVRRGPCTLHRAGFPDPEVDCPGPERRHERAPC